MWESFTFPLLFFEQKIVILTCHLDSLPVHTPRCQNATVAASDHPEPLRGYSALPGWRKAEINLFFPPAFLLAPQIYMECCVCRPVRKGKNYRKQHLPGKIQHCWIHHLHHWIEISLGIYQSSGMSLLITCLHTTHLPHCEICHFLQDRARGDVQTHVSFVGATVHTCTLTLRFCRAIELANLKGHPNSARKFPCKTI